VLRCILEKERAVYPAESLMFLKAKRVSWE
jgi:hypothetical protein